MSDPGEREPATPPPVAETPPVPAPSPPVGAPTPAAPKPPVTAATPAEALGLLLVSVALEALVGLVPAGVEGTLVHAVRPTLHVLAWTAPAYALAEWRGKDPLVVHGILVRPLSLWTLGLALLALPLYAAGFWLALLHKLPDVLPPLLPAVGRAGRDLFFAALPEEYFFRGVFQPSLRLRPGAAIVLTSVAFALAHVVFDPSPARLLVFFPSLLFGWLRLRTGSIVPGIFFHALCNGVEELCRSALP